jgi:hypothetical protein
LQEQNVQSIWELKKLLAYTKSKGHNAIPPLQDDDGNCFVTDHEKSSLLRQIFFPPENSYDSLPISTNNPQGSHIPLVNSAEVQRQLKNMSLYKAAGPDGLPNCFWFHCWNTCAPFVLVIFNLCLRYSLQPDHFQQGRTAVIPKPSKPDYAKAKAYRPITLLNCVAKLLEKVVNARLQYYMESNNLFPPTHYGFRPRLSCDLAALHLIEDVYAKWHMPRKQRQNTGLLLLDISGAYDTVLHPVLIERLLHFEVPDYLTNWIRCFRMRRTTVLYWHGFCSERYKLTQGVPQGSPLSPTLYIIYNALIHDLLLQQQVKSLAFADDIALYCHDTDLYVIAQRLQHAVSVLDTEWGRPSNQQFAPAKFQLIYFTRMPQASASRPTIQFNGITIEHQDTVRYLGIELQFQLKWTEHITVATVKAQKFLSTILRYVSPSSGIPLPALLHCTRWYVLPSRTMRLWCGAQHPSRISSCWTCFSPPP